MPKYYCDYCDIFLTHDSASVRKAHNGGWKHRNFVQEYYSTLPPWKIQEAIDTLHSAYQGTAVLTFDPVIPGQPYGLASSRGPMGGPPGAPRPGGFPGGPGLLPAPPGMPPPPPGMLPPGFPPLPPGGLPLPGMGMPPMPFGMPPGAPTAYPSAAPPKRSAEDEGDDNAAKRRRE